MTVWAIPSQTVPDRPLPEGGGPLLCGHPVYAQWLSTYAVPGLPLKIVVLHLTQ